MARKKKKKKKIETIDVLEERIAVSADELADMIHRINPTGKTVGSAETEERYRVKTRLQNLLVKRHADILAVEQPDPSNPHLVGLNFRYSGKNACHALINELDADARSWVQMQIDQALTEKNDSEEELPKDLGSEVPKTETKQGGGNNNTEENLRLGREALEEYDFDTCEACFIRAFETSGGAPDPALALLELYVDNLAAYEKALDIADNISSGARKNDKVKTLLSLAAARCGRIEEALEYAGRVPYPGVPEAYMISVRHFVEKGDADRASDFLGVLKSIKQDRLLTEIEKLEEGIRSLRARNLEPLELEMGDAWRAGQAETALKLAEKLLSLDPQNQAARNVRSEIEKRQRDEKIDSLLSRADEAGEENDFEREAEMLNHALLLGADAEGLADRLEHARNEAKRKKEETEIRSVIRCWSEGNAEDALLRYIDMNSRQRELATAGIKDPCTGWVDRALSKGATIKPDKLARAVLVMGRAKEELEKAGDPDRIIEEMKPHAKVYQFIPEASDILRRAEELSQSIIHENIEAVLNKAAGLLTEDRADEARRILEGIKPGQLNEKEKNRFEDIGNRLRVFEKQRELEQKYEDALSMNDHLASRELANELSGLTDGETSADWFEKVGEHGADLKREWSIVTADIEDLPLFYANCGIDWAYEQSRCICLTPDRGHVILASSHHKWLFVRSFSVEHQKYEKGLIVRTPDAFKLAGIYPCGDKLWLLDYNGRTAELALDPPDILSWHDFTDMIGEEEIVDAIWLFPRGKFMWLEIRGTFGSRIEVVNIARRRVDRRIKSYGFLSVFKGGDRYYPVIQNLSTGSLNIYSEQGSVLESISFARRIDKITIHPNGNDYVIFPFIDDEEHDDAFVLRLEVIPDPQKKYGSIRLNDTDGETPHFCCTSLDKGIVFLHSCLQARWDLGSKRGFGLAAFRETEHGFEELYKVDAPEDMLFASDEFGRHVAAVIPGEKVRATVLDGNPPKFDHSGKSYDNVFPRFDDPFFPCNRPTGGFNATALAYTAKIKNSSFSALAEIIERKKRPGASSPDDIAAFAEALAKIDRYDEERDLRAWMEKNHPDHFSVLTKLAHKAVEEDEWEEAVKLLEKITRSALDDGTARHVCHLLGMGCFVLGEVKKALEIWEEGTTYEGLCELSPYIEYARLSLMSEKRRQKRKSGLAKALNMYQAADRCMAGGQWLSAVEIIEKADTVSMKDRQAGARLARAYLHLEPAFGETLWLCKIISLASYCELFYLNKYLREDHTFPPTIETYDESRLKSIAVRAQEWLDGL